MVAISSITFTGPSTDTLMGLVNATELPMGFGVGLVPSVFAGAVLTALATREARIERFGPDTPMERYLIGAVLMGFGSMLAGGCAVGAGMSGRSVFAVQPGWRCSACGSVPWRRIGCCICDGSRTRPEIKRPGGYSNSICSNTRPAFFVANSSNASRCA